MEEAGTVDLRGQEVLALFLEALGPTASCGRPAGERDARPACGLGDGRRTAETTTTAASTTTRMARDHRRVVGAVIHGCSTAHGNADRQFRSVHDAAAPLGSAFQDGMYGQIQKDLRQMLGYRSGAMVAPTVAAAISRRAGRVWESLSPATTLERSSGPRTSRTGSAPRRRRRASHRCWRHTVPAIHWINSPTFQQVVQINPRPAAPRTAPAGSVPRTARTSASRFNSKRARTAGARDASSCTTSRRTSRSICRKSPPRDRRQAPAVAPYLRAVRTPSSSAARRRIVAHRDARQGLCAGQRRPRTWSRHRACRLRRLSVRYVDRRDLGRWLQAAT